MAAKPVRFRRFKGSLRKEECSQTPARTAGSASSRMTAAVPPMNRAMGFLKTRHDTESADTKASSRNGRAKSLSRWDAPPEVAVSAAPNVERRDDLSHSRAEQPGEFIGVPIAAHGRSHGGARCGGRMQIYLGHAAR